MARGILALGLCLAAGCGGAASSGADRSSQDTAAFPLLHELALDSPQTTILIREPDNIRLVGPGDGRVLVTDNMDHRIVLLTRQLEFLRAYGRRGGGPGEFQGLSAAVPLAADSILAMDWRTGLLTVFAPSGSVVRIFSWPGPAVGTTMPAAIGGRAITATPVGVLSDGRVVATIVNSRVPRGERTRRLVLVARADSTPPAIIADVPHMLRFTEGTASWGPILYTPQALVAARGNRVLIGITDSTELTLHDLAQSVSAQIPHGLPLVAVTRAEAVAETERRLADTLSLPPFAPPEAMALQQAAIRRIPPAERMPAYSRLILDGAERIWLVRCDAINPGACFATIIDSRGRHVGRFDLPAGFVLHDVGSEGVIGLSEYDHRGRVIEYRGLPPGLRR